MVLLSKKKPTPDTDKATEKKSTVPPPATASKTQKAASSVETIVQTQTDSYRALSRTLGDLITALQQDRAAMIHSRKAHEEVIRRVVDLSKGTPLFLCAAGASQPGMSSVHELASKTSKKFEDTFDEDIIGYVTEWKKIVDVKFETEIKQIGEARKNLAHYQKKMAGLRNEKEKVESQDKQFSPKRVDKFQRNQEKLEEAEHQHDKHVANIAQLSTDLVATSWRDLKPLLVKLLEFDASQNEEKAVILSECRDVLSRLNEISEENMENSPIAMKKLPSEAVVSTNIPMTPGVEKAMNALGGNTKASEEKDETESVTEVDDVHEVREPATKTEV